MKADRKKTELAMARACMNMYDIAAKANMPQNTVKNVLYGKPCKPRTVGRVAKALGVDPIEIIEQEESK